MDYFNNVLNMFLCVDSGRTLAVYEKVRELLDFIKKKKILLCFPKMNEGITGLERHEGMTEFS